MTSKQASNLIYWSFTFFMFSLLTVGFTYAGDIGGMFVCAPFSLLSLGMLIVKIFFPDRMRHDHYIHDERGVK